MSTELIRRPDEVVLCPRGSGQGEPIVVDMKAILIAESRVIEVQSVTPAKAGELLAAFNMSWRDLHQHIVYLEKELNDAERAVNRIRATITLERANAILEEKGLKHTKDNVEAVIQLDPDFIAADERREKIAALIEWFKGKLKSFEMAYTSVKKLLGESAFNFLNRNDHRTSGDSGDRDIGEVSPDERPAQGRGYAGFGTPRY
jgi:hypothetical protein